MSKKQLDILLVEDNEDHAELVIQNLNEHQMPNSIHHVFDGSDALDYVFRRGAFTDPTDSPRPHVILLDLRLPKIDGLEVLKTLKDDTSSSDIPVIVLTTSDADADIAKAYEYHANSYLVKPVTFEKFSELMVALGFYWLNWNQNLPKTAGV